MADLTTLLVGLGASAATAVAAIVAPKFARDGKKIDAELAREQAVVSARTQQATIAQQAEERLQAQIMSLWEKSETKIEQLHGRSSEKIDLLNEKLNAQALEIAILNAKLQILEHSEGSLKAENTRLATDLDRLRRERESLDFENQAQAQLIAEQQGRIATLTAQLAALTAQVGTQSPNPGGNT